MTHRYQQMSLGSIERALQLIKERTATPETQWFNLADFFDLES